MISVCEKITDFLIKIDCIPYDGKDAYMYAVYGLVSDFLFWSIIVALAIMGKNINYLVFTYTVMTFRKYTGGFHLDNANICFVFSLLAVVAGVKVAGITSNIFTDLQFLPLLTASILFVIVKMSPVNHPNLHLSQKEFLIMKNKVCKISIITFVILFLMCIIKSETAYCIFSALALDFILIILAKVFNQEAPLRR